MFSCNRKQLGRSFFYGTIAVYCASMTIQQIRLRNLMFILDRQFQGVVARLARAVDKSPNHIRVVLHPDKPGGRAIGENLARQLEARLGLPRNVLDIEDENLYYSHICTEGNLSLANPGLSAPEIDGIRLTGRIYPLIDWQQAASWATLPQKQKMNPDSWHLCHKDLGANGFVLRVQDESMLAPGLSWSFAPGMLLYVNADALPQSGQFVIVQRAGGAVPVFRRMVTIDGENYLEACNPNWPKRYSPLAADDLICGVVSHAALELP